MKIINASQARNLVEYSLKHEWMMNNYIIMFNEAIHNAAKEGLSVAYLYVYTQNTLEDGCAYEVMDLYRKAGFEVLSDYNSCMEKRISITISWIGKKDGEEVLK